MQHQVQHCSACNIVDRKLGVILMVVMVVMVIDNIENRYNTGGALCGLNKVISNNQNKTQLSALADPWGARDAPWSNFFIFIQFPEKNLVK